MTKTASSDATRGQKNLFTKGFLEVKVWRWICSSCGFYSRRSRSKIPVFARKKCKHCSAENTLEAELIFTELKKVELGTRKLV